MIRQGGPIRFLVGIAVLWCIARSVMLWPPSMASLPRLTYAPPLVTEQRPGDVVRGSRIRLALRPPAVLTIRLDAPKAAAAASPGVIEIAGYEAPPATYVVDFPATAPSNGRTQVPTFEPARSAPRWSASSWAIARSGGGGSQAGLRLIYALGAGNFAVTTRFSSPLSTDRGGREAAFGPARELAAQPVGRTPRRARSTRARCLCDRPCGRRRQYRALLRLPARRLCPGRRRRNWVARCLCRWRPPHRARPLGKRPGEPCARRGCMGRRPARGRAARSRTPGGYPGADRGDDAPDWSRLAPTHRRQRASRIGSGDLDRRRFLRLARSRGVGADLLRSPSPSLSRPVNSR